MLTLLSTVFAQTNNTIDWNSLIQQTAPRIGTNATLGSVVGGRGTYVGLTFYIYIVSGLALIIYLLIGGFTLMTSGGDPKKIESGKHTITNAIIGLVIVLFSYFIVQAIGLIFDIDAINQIF